MSSRTLTTAPLGSSGLEITRVGLGTWAIGGPWAVGWGPQDDTDSSKAIHEGVDRGMNWIDTASVYGTGHSEEVVGRAVAELPEADRPLVFTKCGMTWEEQGGSASRTGDPAWIHGSCDASLERLGLDVIDLLQIHWPPADEFSVEDAWGAMVELRNAGKIRYAGVSNFNAEQLAACEPIGHVDSLQPPLSLINRDVLADAIPWCADHGTGVLVYSPMQSGLLTGSWSQERFDALAEDDHRRNKPEFTGEAGERNLELVERLRPVSERLDCSVPELAIAWTLDQRGVTAAICGARREGQVDGWIGAGEVELDDDAREAIRSAVYETGAGQGPA